MQASLRRCKYTCCLIVILLGWLTLASCARQTPILPVSTTTGTSTYSPATSPQATTPATSTSTPTLAPSVETPSATPTPNPQPVITYTPWELVHDLAWSPDGTHLAVSAGDWVHFYDDATTLSELHSLYTGAWVVDLDYLTGDLLSMADKEGALQFWKTDTDTRLCRMPVHNKGANSLDIDPGSRLLASVGNDAILRIWDLTPLLSNSISPSNGGECSLQLQAEMIGGAFAVPAVSFSPDGTLVASIDLQTVRLRDPLTQRLVRSLYADNSLFDISFSPDGRLLASAELGNQVRLWQVSSGEVLQTLVSNENPSSFMWRVAFSPDGRTLAAGSSDGTITLWDSASGELLRSITAHARAVTALEFSPDGNWLASGSLDASVRLWEVGN